MADEHNKKVRRGPPYALSLDILEEEVELEFLKGSGPGGQHRNKRETGVRLRHPPSGVTVMATERRSQLRNRELAFERLISRLSELNHVRKHRVPTRTPRSAKRKRLDNKRKQSTRKQLRKPPKDW